MIQHETNKTVDKIVNLNGLLTPLKPIGCCEVRWFGLDSGIIIWLNSNKLMLNLERKTLWRGTNINRVEHVSQSHIKSKIDNRQ